MELSTDPIINVVLNGIKREIRVVLENGCLRAVVILIYSGIDSMAFLGMPAGQTDVTAEDFISWVDRYVHFPCADQLTGNDLYGARCAMLHRYGSESRKSRKGECRQVGYLDRSVPEVRFNPAVSTGLALVSVPALAAAFFAGVDRYLVDLYKDSRRGKLADERLKTMAHILPNPLAKKGAD